MFIIFNRTTNSYRQGAGWTENRAAADKFASEQLASKLAGVLASGHAQDIVVEPFEG